MVESRLVETPACPHCAGTRIVHNGSASGLQRYKCRTCRRTFNTLTCTPLARLRMKSKWLQQQDVLFQGLSVSKAATALDVAHTTAFRWRHRFLQLAQTVKASALTGVVEADETFFLRSSKGQCTARKARKRGGRASRKDRGRLKSWLARFQGVATLHLEIEVNNLANLSLSPAFGPGAVQRTGGRAVRVGLRHHHRRRRKPALGSDLGQRRTTARFDLGAGIGTGLLVTLQDSAIGAFDVTVPLQPRSVHGFGTDVAFLPSELRLIGSVAAIP